ncbi:MAG: hypothetical protein M1834_005037 [Cirrosporium novae-zelandiae]|nr:MAG: hypothetical protein M1834_005037 [Cirrosporium novae-zelandiae]
MSPRITHSRAMREQNDASSTPAAPIAATRSRAQQEKNHTPSPQAKAPRRSARIMSEALAAGGGTTPSNIIPQKRLADDVNDPTKPSVSSPLNPDFNSSTSRAKRAPAREQREKKDSLKKRESKSTPSAESARGDTPEKSSGGGRKGSKKGVAQAGQQVLSPLRYKLPPPKPADFNAPSQPALIPHHVKTTSAGTQTQFFETSEFVHNKKGFRYTYSIADPSFPSSLYYRQTETEPFNAHFSFEDSSPHILFDQPAKTVTTEKGFRMARANVGAREGNWYYECKIVSGIKSKDAPNGNGDDAGGHVRLGWARREASLETPVGFDAYSYGLRDVSGHKMHMSRPASFFPPGEDICEGDIIGLEINLPSLSLHRKVVEGSYNKAVDVSPEQQDENIAAVSDIIRDRVPIRYKNHVYFEHFEYHTTKELEDLMNPSPVNTLGVDPPHPNHPQIQLRTLPFSCIKIYKNGVYIGTPFTNLLAFLPPASKPQNQLGARDGLDDGILGYFPAVSVFRGGAAEINLGPDFWYPPPGYMNKSDIHANTDTAMPDADASPDPSSINKTPLTMLRPIGERYDEQIAEDIVYDLIDEVDFWLQDGASTDVKDAGNMASTVLGPVDPDAPGVDAAARGLVNGNHTGEIKEIVQEDE